ncbi:Ras-related protein Rab-5A [Tritrichomonas foetus]|uniref:Ras-related protein Rab-5A n=1 Tax=Tritrichomonas foetus TaxID=1144522 RepID=A0A1J4J2U9_9EUKA|nr:Ras-related protein Rab-5A [Tritrichomonas foetus]|eukprot:OHS93750.1 Ras-related protein Rab-5A [Tritrichomonas foetus]
MKMKKYKVVLFGPYGVGKTNIISVFCDGKYNEESKTTINANFLPANIIVDSENSVLLHIWDTAGQEKYRCLLPMYIRNADSLVLVFDISSKESFLEAEKWYYEIQNEKDVNSVTILVGNKHDLVGEVNQTQYLEFCEQNKAIFIMTSAKNGMNISDLFQLIACELIKRDMGYETSSDVSESVSFKSCC